MVAADNAGEQSQDCLENANLAPFRLTNYMNLTTYNMFTGYSI